MQNTEGIIFERSGERDKPDQIIRIVVGLVLVVLGFTTIGWWGAFAAIPLLTGAVGWCPLYVPFNFSTRK